MEIPEHIQHLVNRLGEAVVRAISMDADAREVAARIHEGGFEVAVMAEATIILKKREDGDEGDASKPPAPPPGELHRAPAPPPDRSHWSEDDRAFLHTFKISLD